MTCGLVMFPYLIAGSAGVRQITIDISLFLLTRFIVYFLMATIAWNVGQALFSNHIVRNIVPGILYIVFAVMLVWYSVGRNKNTACPAKIVTAVNNKKLIPVFLGIVNSLGFCPALFIMVTKSAAQESVSQSYLAFLAFFIGSSLWFLPLPLTGKMRKGEAVRTIALLATGLAGIIYMIKGITNLIGGIING